jgi:hypothetical protein
MTRVAPILAVLALLAPALAAGGAAPGGRGEGVTVPIYHPDTGDLICRIVARKVSPSEADPKMLLADDVEVTFHHGGKKHVATADAGLLDIERRSGSLEGHVVLTFAHEHPITLKSSRLEWFGPLGLATTETPDAAAREALAKSETPAAILRKLVEASTTPVTVTSEGITIEGLGLLVAVGALEDAPKGDAPADTVLLGRQIKTTVTKSGSARFLGSRDEPPKPKADAAEPKPDEPAAKDRPEPEEPTGADGPKPPKPPPPVVVTAPGPLVFHRNDLTAVYHSNDQRSVRVAQGPISLVCATLTLAFRVVTDPETNKTTTGFEGVTAHGKVRIDSGQDFALADTAAWHSRDGFSLLVGRPATVTWDNGNLIAAGRIRRKTRLVREQDPKTRETTEREVLDWLECSTTPDYPHSVFLRARTPAAVPGRAPETARAPAQAPQDR